MLSIGTLVAYTMVAIAVLVTRYTPGVQSVTASEENTQQKSNKFLQSICCCPEETEGPNDLIPEVSYHQVQNNDKESSMGTEQPDEQTSFFVRFATFVLTFAITGFTVCLAHASARLARGEAWVVLLCGMFGLMIVLSLTYISRQPRNSATFPFMVPGVPIIPALSIFFNVLLLVMLNQWTYIRFSVWMALGKNLVFHLTVVLTTHNYLFMQRILLTSFFIFPRILRS